MTTATRTAPSRPSRSSSVPPRAVVHFGASVTRDAVRQHLVASRRLRDAEALLETITASAPRKEADQWFDFVVALATASSTANASLLSAIQSWAGGIVAERVPRGVIVVGQLYLSIPGDDDEPGESPTLVVVDPANIRDLDQIL